MLVPVVKLLPPDLLCEDLFSALKALGDFGVRRRQHLPVGETIHVTDLETVDQQPVEATATIAACLTAWRADGDAEWKAMATRVFAWFLGSNDLAVALVDPHTGSCRDGLHPDRANENRGGESVVSYLLGLADIRQLARVNVNPTNPVALRAIGA